MRLLSLLDVVVTFVTVVAAVLLLLASLAPYINPNSAVIFSYLGLAFPVLYIVNFSVLLYWVLRWKRRFIIPMMALVLGLGKLALIFQPTIGKRYTERAKERSAITVVSHNVHGFLNDDKVYIDNILTQINSFNPDIVCMQEFQITPNISRQRADELLKALPERSIFFKLPGEGNGGFGLAIYSRYPIIKADCKNFEDHSGFVMWADVVCLRDTVRVFNCHFQTTSIDASDREFVTSTEFMQQDAGVSKRKVRSILSKLGNNFRLRAMQADTIASFISKTPHDVIVCGDFNDTPISYTYRTVRGRLSDSYVEKGAGHANTYKGFFNLLRIDYIFHSKSYKTLYYAEPSTKWSDHNPVVATIKKR